MTPTYNSALGDRVLAHIRDHREQWNQNTFHNETKCGTTHCVAGWAVALTGRDAGVTDYREAIKLLRPAEWTGYFGAGAAGTVALGLAPNGLRVLELFYDTAWCSWSGNSDATLERVEELMKHFSNNPEGDSLP